VAASTEIEAPALLETALLLVVKELAAMQRERRSMLSELAELRELVTA